MALHTSLARREAIVGWTWVQAWFAGFVLFTAGPILAAFVLAFTSWNGSGSPTWIGLENFRRLFTGDPLFWQSLKVTALFAVLYLPSSLVVGLTMALLMNQNLPGIRVLRTIYYLPSVLSGVAVAILWLFVFNRDFGVLNWMLSLVGIQPVPWLQSEFWVVPSIVLMTLWGVGASIIIYLGGLQGIPTELYEVARLDGARWWGTFRAVTVPMMSPVIFFQLVLGVISSLQIFTQAYVMTQGGPNYASYFYVLNLYNQAFQNLNLGYACAMAVVLFLIVAGVTLVIFKTSNAWVYYAGARGTGT